MYKVSVSNVEKTYGGMNFDSEQIRSLRHEYVEFPMPHILFESIKKTVNDYMYYVDGGGCVWRKTKYKDEYYYFDEEYQEWLIDEDMDTDYLNYTAANEFMCRLTA